MEYRYSLALALVDFIPNLAFLVGAYFLVNIFRQARGDLCARIGMAGSLLIFTGGLIKAIWKLLYTLNIADIVLFYESQFALLAPGFLALLVAVILLAREKPLASSKATLAMAAWKIPMLFVMTLSSLGAQGILAYIAFKRGSRLAAWCFIIAVICMLGMSGMASAEQTIANQWIAEMINTFWQLLFAFGAWLLYKNYRAFPTVSSL